MKSAAEIIFAISNGQLKEHLTPNVELKRSWEGSYGKKLSALSNKITFDRMWVVVGVEDSGVASGHDEGWAKKTEETVSQQINTKLDPFQACVSVKCHQAVGGWIIAIELTNPGAVVKWEGNAYKSSGTTCEKMLPDEIMELTIKLPGLLDFSKQKVSRNVDAERETQLCNLLRQSNPDLEAIVDDETLLRTLRIYGTQAERILIGNMKFRFVTIDEDDNVVRNDTFKGAVQMLQPEFANQIRDWFQKTSGSAVPLSDTILREAIGNVIAHTAYNDNNGEIVIELHSDKLIFSNLCYPEYKAFANKWFSRVHKSPNSLLMEVLRTMKKTDELGKGKQKIFTESAKAGYRPPVVEMTQVGRYNRWSLNIFCNNTDLRVVELLQKIESTYGDKYKSQIALALILWRKHKVTEITKYFGDAEYGTLAEVLTDISGPIFYYKEKDQIILNRWVNVLLNEGKASKQFSPAEERRFYDFLFKIKSVHDDGHFTSGEVRKYGHLSDSQSDTNLISGLTKKWIKERKVERLGKGKFRFLQHECTIEENSAQEEKVEVLEKIEQSSRDSENA